MTTWFSSESGLLSKKMDKLYSICSNGLNYQVIHWTIPNSCMIRASKAFLKAFLICSSRSGTEELSRRRLKAFHCSATSSCAQTRPNTESFLRICFNRPLRELQRRIIAQFWEGLQESHQPSSLFWEQSPSATSQSFWTRLWNSCSTWPENQAIKMMPRFTPWTSCDSFSKMLSWSTTSASSLPQQWSWPLRISSQTIGRSEIALSCASPPWQSGFWIRQQFKTKISPERKASQFGISSWGTKSSATTSRVSWETAVTKRSRIKTSEKGQIWLSSAFSCSFRGLCQHFNTQIAIIL